MKIDNSSKYILAIVGIVAVVGIVVLVLNTGVQSFSGTDVTGQALSGGSINPDTLLTSPKDTDGDGFSDLKERAVGTNPKDASDYPMPELVLDKAGTSIYLEGTVYYDSSGVVIGEDVAIRGNCGIRNDGTATAVGSRGYILNACFFCDDYSSTVCSLWNDADIAYTSIAVGGTYAWSEPAVDYNSPFFDFFQEIYDGGAVDGYMIYDIDYASDVLESDETNNYLGVVFSIDSSMYTLTWIEGVCTMGSIFVSGINTGISC